jgi:hypothetical protein
MSPLEHQFGLLWYKVVKGPVLEREFAFDPKRKWRFDFAHVATKTAFEIEGGLGWNGKRRGRHLRPLGFVADCEKYTEATLLGWVVFRLPSDHVHEPWLKRLANFLKERTPCVR